MNQNLLVSKVEEQSHERITEADLKKLASLAQGHRDDWFRHDRPTVVYESRFLSSALCEGAALHYMDGKTGVKDFDVYEFYADHPHVTIPYRSHWQYDFGPSKFGRWGQEKKRTFEGRHVDLFVRALPVEPDADPIEAVQAYLEEGQTLTARLLAKKAVVLLEPDHLRGNVVWPVE